MSTTKVKRVETPWLMLSSGRWCGENENDGIWLCHGGESRPGSIGDVYQIPSGSKIRLVATNKPTEDAMVGEWNQLNSFYKMNEAMGMGGFIVGDTVYWWIEVWDED